MEPSIIDYYNDYPKIIDVIDSMNLELDDLKKQNDILKKEIYDLSIEHSKELKEYKKFSELKLILLTISYEKNKKKKKKFLCF